MKRTILAASVSLACCLAVNAQTSANTRGDVSNQTSNTASTSNKTVSLESGTRLSGELQSTLDARHAKVGDQVVLKTTQAIKSGGHTVVSKGSRLIGHVTEVSQQSKSNGESRVGLLFDRLEGGSLNMPIAATITSIVNSNARARANDEDIFANDSSSTTTSARAGNSRSSSGNNGLLGGAVNSTAATVGSVVGGTTAAVGSAVGSTASVTGNTANGLGSSLGGIQISQSSSTSAEGAAVLSLQGRNLRLEKGVTFNLMLTQTANASTSRH